jgi:hypothetical protein
MGMDFLNYSGLLDSIRFSNKKSRGPIYESIYNYGGYCVRRDDGRVRASAMF